MLVLRCTIKAFKKIGIKPQAVEVTESSPTLGEWYVNTVDHVNGGDMLIAFMHSSSLYAMLVPIPEDLDAESLVGAFHSHLLTHLLALETPPDAVHRILSAYEGTAVLAKTRSRKHLGHFNSIMQDMDSILASSEDVIRDGNTILIPRVEHHLNETPHSLSKNYVQPLQEFWKCIRALCPDLPPRQSLALWIPVAEEVIDTVAGCFQEHLGSYLTNKFCAMLQESGVLFDADELRSISDAIGKVLDSGQPCPAKLLTDLDRQVRFQVERLQDD